MKATALLAKAFSNPLEFADRLLTFTENRIHRPNGKAPNDLLKTDSEIMEAAGQLSRFKDSPGLKDITNHVEQTEGAIPLPPSGIAHNATRELAIFCYCWCRAHKPTLVVETGVANGVTSAFILQAMKDNGSGELWSIDLPSLGTDAFVGFLIPQNLRNRWHLYRGRSRRLLPKIIKSAGTIDAFLHDSLHTERNMRFEFESAWPALVPSGVLISDDVTYFNNSFQDFVCSHESSFNAIHPAGFGVAIKPAY